MEHRSFFITMFSATSISVFHNVRYLVFFFSCLFMSHALALKKIE